MAPKFGTSGLRGLVTELTPELVADHVRGFIAACDVGDAVFVGRDLRPSSPDIAAGVLEVIRGEGLLAVDCGAVPTPALALASMQAGAGAVMITGSHIPADRNGLKFYARSGEISKVDEAAIHENLGRPPAGGQGDLRVDTSVAGAFVERYVAAFGPALQGKRIGLYAHSAVGRDDMRAVLEGLGAEVTELGRSDHFIPVDTEAVDPDTRAQIQSWVAEHALDALVSTDGDSDRPLLADEKGRIVPGDVMGQITAETLGAQTVVTPISSNSGVAKKAFEAVVTTQIGSPYVIAAMETSGGDVVGYEANGGFLLGFAAQGPKGPLAPLPTRDCVLPLVAALVAAGQGPVSARVAQEPPVVTMADRLQQIEQEVSGPFVQSLRTSAEARAAFLTELGATEAGLDLTDGVRMQLTQSGVVHIRPSGNAPELRLYVEDADQTKAAALMRSGLAALRAAFS